MKGGRRDKPRRRLIIRSRPDRPRICRPTGKVRFKTEEDAHRNLAIVRRSTAGADHWYIPRRVYECDHCGGWHTTHLATVQHPRPFPKHIARTLTEAPMPTTSVPRGFDSLVKRIAELLAEEYDAYRAADALGLPFGTYCATCTVAVTVRFDSGDEVAIRDYADLPSGALCLGGDCERDAALSGWFEPLGADPRRHVGEVL